MRRRHFIVYAGAAVLAWPLAAPAQRPGPMRRIGVLMPLPEDDPEAQRRFNLIRLELQQHGWIEASSIHIDVRWDRGELGEQQALADELVALQPDILFAQSTAGVTAFARATRTIPIVFVQVTDPVGQGLIVSFERPGGAITGFSNFDPAIGGKWLQPLKEIAPQLAHVAVLFNPETAPYFGLYLRSVELSASTFSVRVTAAAVHDVPDIESAMSLIGHEPNSGLILPPDIFTSNHRQLINSLAIRYQLPLMCSFPYMVADGGLMSYGPDVVTLYRRAVSYVDRVLRGERPSELQVQQPTKFEFVINLKTAGALKLEIPPTLLARADKVFE